ncbi:MAG: hypothetical protein A2Y25_00265 [Candidatus Melainabacteria bacterium GWF2_37_15]|nr:MAG: hypothetical protein A2Y25_00265 [Candidatus Melainabacteria bacterium GWF2_37_15]
MIDQSNITVVREALQELVHHVRPIANISRQVIEEIPRGNGQRTKEMIVRLYDPKASNPFGIKNDVYESCLEHLDHLYRAENPGYMYVQRLFHTVVTAVKSFGAGLSNLKN